MILTKRTLAEIAGLLVEKGNRVERTNQGIKFNAVNCAAGKTDIRDLFYGDSLMETLKDGITPTGEAFYIIKGE